MTGPVVGRTVTQEGHEILRTAARWARIMERHPETIDYLELILHTVPARTIRHETRVELGCWSHVPIVNGLTAR